LIVDAPHSLQRRARIGFLHGGVELALERFDVVLVVHLMIPRYFPSSADVGAAAPREAIGAIAKATSTVVGESESAGAGDVAEQEIQVRLASIGVGLWLTVIVCLGAAIYALHTWSEPNRDLILVSTGLGLLSVPLVRALPGEQ